MHPVNRDMQGGRYLATSVRGNGFNMSQGCSIPATFVAEVDRRERDENPAKFVELGKGGEDWQGRRGLGGEAYIEQRCCELVAEEDYYKTSEGALGPRFPEFYETIKAETLRIHRGFIAWGGDLKEVVAVRASQVVKEGETYDKIRFRSVTFYPYMK